MPCTARHPYEDLPNDRLAQFRLSQFGVATLVPLVLKPAS
jgi:hypothetical protein